MFTLLYTVRNANAANPIAGSAVDNTHSGTTLTAPSITTTNSHTMALNLLANTDSIDVIKSPMSGTAWDWRDYASKSGAYINIAASHAIATTTTTSTAIWAGTNSSPWIAGSLAINPASDPYTINANLTWTASTTAWATGYTWERWDSSLQQTSSVSDVSTTTGSDSDALTSGTTYTYKLRTDANGWYSGQATTTITPTCP
jgi:hypothetical protein